MTAIQENATAILSPSKRLFDHILRQIQICESSLKAVDIVLGCNCRDSNHLKRIFLLQKVVWRRIVVTSI